VSKDLLDNLALAKFFKVLNFELYHSESQFLYTNSQLDVVNWAKSPVKTDTLEFVTDSPFRYNSFFAMKKLILEGSGSNLELNKKFSKLKSTVSACLL
jgi:hypothetical protein